MATPKVIGFKIRLEGSTEAVKELAKIELIGKDLSKQLKATEKAINEATAAGDTEQVAKLTEQYTKLRAEQLAAAQAGNELRKGIREQQKSFKNLEFAEGSYRALNAQLGKLRNAYKELSAEEIKTGRISQETADKLGLATRDVAKLTTEISKLDTELKETDASLGQFQRNVGNYPTSINAALQGVVPGFSELQEGIEQTGNIASKTGKLIARSFLILGVVQQVGEWALALKELTGDFSKLRGELEATSKTSGEELDKISVQTSALATTFSNDANEITQAANAAAKTFGGSFGDALAGLENGFLRNADLSGDFLDKVKEYAPQFKAAGLGFEDLINTIVQEVDAGIFSDKGVDTVKEFGLRIREQTTATSDALSDAFGKTFTDKIFKGINDGTVTTGQALEQISEKIKNTEIPTKQLQAVITDVFGGAGEDAGIDFIKSLENIDSATLGAIDSQSQFIIAQKRLLESNKSVADSLNELTKATGQGGVTFDIVSNKAKEFGIRLLTSFLNAFAPLIDGFKAIGSAASDLLKPFGVFNEGAGFIQFFTDNIARATKIIASVIGTQLKVYAAWGRAISNVVNRSEFLQKVIAGVRTVISAVSAAFNNFRGQISSAAAVISRTLSPVIEFLQGLVIQLVDGFASFNKAIFDVLRQVPFIASFFRSIQEGGKSLIDIFSNLPATFAGVVAALVQLGRNFSGFFKEQVLTAQIFAKEIERALSVRSSTISNLDNEIQALQNQKTALADAGKTLGEAFTDAYNETVKLSDASGQFTALEANTPATQQAAPAAPATAALPSNEQKKDLEEQNKAIEDAAKQIRALKTELIDNSFDKEIAKLNQAAQDRIAGLIGTPEQIAEQTALIKAALLKSIQEVETQRQTAQDKAKADLLALSNELKSQIAAGGLASLESEQAAIELNLRLNTSELETEISARKQALSEQLAAGLISRESYNDSVIELEREQTARLFELKQQVAISQQQIEVDAFAAKVALLNIQAEQEKERITAEFAERQAQLQAQREGELITQQEYNNALVEIERLKIEQIRQLELETRDLVAEEQSNLAIQTLEQQQLLADEEVRINEEKNEKIRAAEERTTQQRAALANNSLDLLSTIVSGTKNLLGKDEKNRKKYAGILKGLALSEIAINLAIELANIAKASSQNKLNGVTFGAAGTAQYAIQGAIAVARAAFATAGVLAQSFADGGAIGSGLTVTGGGSIPNEGLTRGNSHNTGDITAIANGQPIRVEGGEYALNAGGQKLIINKRSTKMFKPVLDKMRGNRMPAKAKKGVASILNQLGGGVAFQDGGSLFAPSSPLPAPFPINQFLPQSGGTSSELVEQFQLLAAQLQANTAATNERIDRIVVVSDPSEIYEKGKEESEIKETETL